MPDARIEPHLYRAAGGGDARGEAHGVARLDRRVAQARCEQHRRLAAVDEADRLARVAHRLGKDPLQRRILERQEIVRTGEPDHAREIALVETVRAEKAAVGREQRRDLRARRMAGDMDAPRIRAERGRMVARPAHRRGRVLDEARKHRVRIEPVIGYRDDAAARRERLADEPVIAAPAALPTAAVKEHHERRAAARRPRLARGRQIDVERAARPRAVREAETPDERRTASSRVQHDQRIAAGPHAERHGRSDQHHSCQHRLLLDGASNHGARAARRLSRRMHAAFERFKRRMAVRGAALHRERSAARSIAPIVFDEKTVNDKLAK